MFDKPHPMMEEILEEIMKYMGGKDADVIKQLMENPDPGQSEKVEGTETPLSKPSDGSDQPELGPDREPISFEEGSPMEVEIDSETPGGSHTGDVEISDDEIDALLNKYMKG